MIKLETFMGVKSDVDWNNLKIDIPFDNVECYYCDIDSRGCDMPLIKIMYKNGKYEERMLDVLNKCTLTPGGIRRIIFESGDNKKMEDLIDVTTFENKEYRTFKKKIGRLKNES